MMTETFQEETFQEEEMMEEEAPMMTETFQEEDMVEEKPTKMAKEEEIDEEETVEEKPTKMVKATDEKKEKIKQEKPNSKTAKKSAVQTKENTKQKKIQSQAKTANVKSQSKYINIQKVMDKVDKDIKDISKNLQIKNIIKLQIMTNDQVSLNSYANTQFYEPKNIYLDQLNIFDNRQIYPNKSLATYIQNDKMDIKARKLEEIKSKKQKLLLELEVLKNG